MRTHEIPASKTPREIVLQHALILRRLSSRMEHIYSDPDAGVAPENLRRALADGAETFRNYADELETLGLSDSHTPVRVPTWRDGVEVALGFIAPCAVFLGFVALMVANMPTEARLTEEELLRNISEREWMDAAEQRFNETK